MKHELKVLTGLIFGAALSATSAAHADIVYPNIGHENTVTYTFTAAADGPITAYFAGSTAAFTEEVTMLVNGTPTGIIGLNNKTTTLGASVVLGNVHAGDSIVFEDIITSPSNVGPWYSDPAMNTADGFHNHVYSVQAAAGQAYATSPFGPSPAGTYVAFEDLPASSSDWNYHDDTFVFTNVASSAPGPVPGAGLAGLAALALAGFYARMRRA